MRIGEERRGKRKQKKRREDYVNKENIRKSSTEDRIRGQKEIERLKTKI